MKSTMMIKLVVLTDFDVLGHSVYGNIEIKVIDKK